MIDDCSRLCFIPPGVHCYCLLSRSQLGGQTQPGEWGGFNRLGDENDVITVDVNNVLKEKKINNVFGMIKGFVDAGKM